MACPRGAQSNIRLRLEVLHDLQKLVVCTAREVGPCNSAQPTRSVSSAALQLKARTTFTKLQARHAQISCWLENTLFTCDAHEHTRVQAVSLQELHTHHRGRLGGVVGMAGGEAHLVQVLQCILHTQLFAIVSHDDSYGGVSGGLGSAARARVQTAAVSNLTVIPLTVSFSETLGSGSTQSQTGPVLGGEPVWNVTIVPDAVGFEEPC